MCKRKFSNPCCMMKLDLKKAYDTVSWSFLRQMLEGIEFPQSYVEMIMTYVTTPKISFMINGLLTCFYNAQGGLRQRPDVSTSFCHVYYLDRTLRFSCEREGFKFHVKCKEMKLSHLCFAGDLLMFLPLRFHINLYLTPRLSDVFQCLWVGI